VLRRLADRGILGGFDLIQDYPEFGMRSSYVQRKQRRVADIDVYASALGEVMPGGARGLDRKLEEFF